MAVTIHHSTAPLVMGNVEAGVGLITFGLQAETTDGLRATDNSVVTFPAGMNLNLASP